MSKVAQLHSGQRLGRHLLSCYIWLAAAAREQLRAHAPHDALPRIQRRRSCRPALHRDGDLVHGARLRGEQRGLEPREHDDRHRFSH